MNVTRLQCGNTYNITNEKEIYIDFESYTTEKFEDCVIKVANDDYDKMICIENKGPIDMDCLYYLSYHIGEVRKFDADHVSTHLSFSYLKAFQICPVLCMADFMF